MAENRLLMVGIFKRQAKIVATGMQTIDENTNYVLDELVNIYIMLISLTGFLEV